MSTRRCILVTFQILLCFCVLMLVFNDSMIYTNTPALRFVQTYDRNRLESVVNDGTYNRNRLETVVNDGNCLKTKSSPPFYICTHNVTEDIYISNSLANDGVWEPKMTKTLQDILERETNVTFIDIGANIGYFSLLAAVHGFPVIAVEPIVANIQCFQKAIVMNQFQNKILLLQNVISDVRSTSVTLRLERNNQGSARILNHNEFNDKNNKMVDGTSIILDDLIGLIQTPDVIIKVDVEGHECKVLEGSKKLFKLFNVKAVFTEWQKMAHRKYIYGSACGPEDIHRLASHLAETGLKPYDIQHGHKLDVLYSVKWTAGDVVWKRKHFNNTAYRLKIL